jgi:hypothetical protein
MDSCLGFNEEGREVRVVEIPHSQFEPVEPILSWAFNVVLLALQFRFLLHITLGQDRIHNGPLNQDSHKRKTECVDQNHWPNSGEIYSG